MNEQWIADQKEKQRHEFEEKRKEILHKVHECDLYNQSEKDELTNAIKRLQLAETSYSYANNLFFEMKCKLIVEKDDLRAVEKHFNELDLDNFLYMLNNNVDRYADKEKYFDGDIIITDPCYIIKEQDESTRPEWHDYHRYNSIKEYPDYDKKANTSELFFKESDKMDKAVKEWEKQNPDDWSKCHYGEKMENIGIENYITRDTLYGDWSCTTYNSDTKEKIGEFCADAGLVSVFLLDEVLKYNPNFDYHTERKWTTTLVKDFKGIVRFVVVHHTWVYEETTEYHNKGDIGEDFSVEVVGHGINSKTGEIINFVGKQTGL